MMRFFLTLIFFNGIFYSDPISCIKKSNLCCLKSDEERALQHSHASEEHHCKDSHERGGCCFLRHCHRLLSILPSLNTLPHHLPLLVRIFIPEIKVLQKIKSFSPDIFHPPRALIA